MTLDYTHPEKCPICKGIGKENVGIGIPVVWELVACRSCGGSGKFTPYYKDQYRLAIIDALNVLGVPGEVHEPARQCQGCQYERDDAMVTLYSALGLHIDWKHATECYEEFCKIRNAEWDSRKERKLPSVPSMATGLPYKTIAGCYPSCPAQWGNFVTETRSDGRTVIQGGHIAGCPNTYPNCELCWEPGHFAKECPKHHA